MDPQSDPPPQSNLQSWRSDSPPQSNSFPRSDSPPRSQSSPHVPAGQVLHWYLDSSLSVLDSLETSVMHSRESPLLDSRQLPSLDSRELPLLDPRELPLPDESPLLDPQKLPVLTVSESPPRQRRYSRRAPKKACIKTRLAEKEREPRLLERLVNTLGFSAQEATHLLGMLPLPPEDDTTHKLYTRLREHATRTKRDQCRRLAEHLERQDLQSLLQAMGKRLLSHHNVAFQS